MPPLGYYGCSGHDRVAYLEVLLREIGAGGQAVDLDRLRAQVAADQVKGEAMMARMERVLGWFGIKTERVPGQKTPT